MKNQHPRLVGERGWGGGTWEKSTKGGRLTIVTLDRGMYLFLPHASGDIRGPKWGQKGRGHYLKRGRAVRRRSLDAVSCEEFGR